MNPVQIIREAAATIKDRPLTEEEGRVAAQAMADDAFNCKNLLDEIAHVMAKAIVDGLVLPIEVSRVLAKSAVYRLTGEMLEVP